MGGVFGMLDLKALLAKILSHLKSPIIFKEVTSSVGASLSAHGTTYIAVNVPEVAGYKMLGAIYSRTNGNVWLSYCGNTGNGALGGTVNVWIRNTSTGASTIGSVTIGVLYIRSDLF